MTNIIDIDYLVDSMEELCRPAPVTVEQANSCKSTIIWGLNQSYNTLASASLICRQNYIERVNRIISMYQFPSLLVYTRINEFPYLFDAIAATDNRLTYMGQIRSSEELLNVIMIKNIDNNLSDAIIRLINYMDNLISDVSFDILYKGDSNILELALIGLTQLIPTNVSEYVFSTMFDDYECDLMSECDYDYALDAYEPKHDMSDDDYYTYNAGSVSILLNSRKFMYDAWRNSFVVGDPISRDLIYKGLATFGVAFVENAGEHVLITPSEKETLLLDYREQMYIDCNDAILRNYLNTLCRHAREEVLRSINDDIKIKTFTLIVKTFQFIIKIGREAGKK